MKTALCGANTLFDVAPCRNHPAAFVGGRMRDKHSLPFHMLLSHGARSVLCASKVASNPGRSCYAALRDKGPFGGPTLRQLACRASRLAQR